MSIRNFFKQEYSAGVLLIFSMLLAMFFANFVPELYNKFLTVQIEVKVGELLLSKPSILWINDGLMAIFFFLVGLELKREFIEGDLKEPRKALLPLFGAIGGMAIPALVYVVINLNNDIALEGWAIPTATDIAFALGILMLIKNIPIRLKMFLTTLAIIDDVGAILIIAFFYTADLSTSSLMLGGSMIFLMFLSNRFGITNLFVYFGLGAFLWLFVLKSGVHATLAGVVAAFFIPYKTGNGTDICKPLEHSLHGPVYFFVLPIFAFANAGVNLSDVGSDDLFHPITIGIILGLFLGKQIGVFLFSYLAIKLKISTLPKGIKLSHIYGVSLLCGVGFTMSLFIGSLAFEHNRELEYFIDDRIGVLIGSFLSAVAGYFVLSRVTKKRS